MGYCPDTQCMQVIASEMRKINTMEKRKNKNKWINKNKLMAMNISRQMNRKAAKREEEEHEENKVNKDNSSTSPKNSNKKGKKKKEKNNKNNNKNNSDSKSSAVGSTSMTVGNNKKGGLFGTGVGKYADRMCKIQLDVVGGVYPVDRPEKYMVANVPKSEVMWYPPLPEPMVRKPLPAPILVNLCPLLV